MKLKHLMVAATIAVSAFGLYGCGSDLGSDDESSVDSGSAVSNVANAASKGVDNCAQCHQNPLPDETVHEKWLRSRHAVNYFSASYAAIPGCTDCHDPNGDNVNMESAYGLSDDMYVVGCEACHGGGQFHSGLGPIAYPSPGPERCGQCHNADFDHRAYHPFADEIVENYTMGAHSGTLAAGHGSSDSGFRARCAVCHSDQGFRKYADAARGLGHDDLVDYFNDKPEILGSTDVECNTCHDSHSTELRTEETVVTLDSDGDALSIAGTSAVNADAVAFSAQFNLCTTCHQIWLDYDWDEATQTFSYTLDDDVYGADDATAASYHSPAANSYSDPNETDRMIADTHFAGMLSTRMIDTGDLADNTIAGYNINAADVHVCSQCHDVHGATKFEQSYAVGIAEDWGNTASFHGDYQGEDEHGAFTYPSYGSCAACHSGTEFVKLTEGQAFDELDGGEQRPVACVSCHDLQAKNEEGTAFDLGAIRTIDDFVFPGERFKADADEDYDAVTFADLGADALCMTCHSGRKSLNEVAAYDGTNFASVNPHYKVAGAVAFGTDAKGGYEFGAITDPAEIVNLDDAGLFGSTTYDGRFAHVSALDSCVECHSAHDGELKITAPYYDPEALSCGDCHTGAVDIATVRDIRTSGTDFDGDGNVTEGVYYEIEGLKALLEAELLSAGMTFTSYYPYVGNITTNAQLKAAYNYKFVSNDPGAYAHNADYAIQLLYDSLVALGADVSLLTRD